MSSATGSSYTYIGIDGITKKQSVTLTSIKSSNKNVFEPVTLYRSENSDTTYYIGGSKKESYSSVWSDINIEAKKPGTANLSFKVGSKTYTSKITVKKYTNPLKSLTITGINSNKNIASKFKSQTYSDISLKSNGKKGSVKVTPNTNWKVVYLQLYDNSNDRAMYLRSSKGLSSASLPMIEGLKAGKSYNVYIQLVNTKDNGTQNISFNIHK